MYACICPVDPVSTSPFHCKATASHVSPERGLYHRQGNHIRLSSGLKGGVVLGRNLLGNHYLRLTSMRKALISQTIRFVSFYILIIIKLKRKNKIVPCSSVWIQWFCCVTWLNEVGLQYIMCLLRGWTLFCASFSRSLSCDSLLRWPLNADCNITMSFI